MSRGQVAFGALFEGFQEEHRYGAVFALVRAHRPCVSAPPLPHWQVKRITIAATVGVLQQWPRTQVRACVSGLHLSRECVCLWVCARMCACVHARVCMERVCKCACAGVSACTCV